ncbi:MAG TPA: SDR family oxidoreductase [Tepidisphaeraceae bacterium]|jgi:NAD(P)-dependent dehydrogenase (short-subunit alcohol dehydrogenase family)
MNRLKDKIAIVTGAANGIGRAIAEAFAGAGAQVILADLDESAGRAVAGEIEKTGGRATFVPCDVSSEKQVQDVVNTAAGFGPVNILCNNAAYIANWHNVVEASDEEWDRSYRVSLRGASLFMKYVLPMMTSKQAGSIINISSVQGMVAARQSAAYTAMKHALIGLTRNAAYDYGPSNIRVNALCPGPIRVRYSPAPGTELHTRQINKTFLGRTGEPSEVAAAAVFLASDEASYITGAVLPVDGGWTCM